MQNTVTQVALTQVPYTGFDFGPVGNAVYWTSLTIVSLALAYIVIFYTFPWLKRNTRFAAEQLSSLLTGNN